MTQSPVTPINEPNKVQPAVGPQQTEAEKKAQAEKEAAANAGDSKDKS